ncbi:MAG: MATE family efflux transporter [Chitinophagaceae bacterium]|nr:MATE family efflux transporter [Chitinophagaceae bacterium]
MAGTSSNIDLRLNISYQQILKISLPISASLLVPQINFITNNIFLSGLGERELGAAGITGVFYLIFACIGMGLNNGLQSLISRRAGENRIEEIGKIFSQGVIISIAVAALGIVLTYLLAPVVFRYTIHSQETYDMCVHFLKVRIWGLPFLYLYQMRNALLVGTNQSKYLVVGTVAEAVTNVFFDYSLIYGHFGLPALGFNGAAYASIIAEFTGMFVVFAIIHFKKFHQSFSLYKHFRFNKSMSKLVLGYSSPLIMQYAISIISWEFFYILIEHKGERDLAISNTMRNIFGFFGVFTWAFAATSNTMVSNIIGQGQKENVIPLIHKIVRISAGTAIGICIILNFFPHFFLSVYGRGEDFIEAAIPILRVVSTALVLMSFSTVWLNAVTGTGNTKINLGIEAVAIVLYCVYAYIVLEKLNLPTAWGWAAEWLYWSTLFIFSYLYIKSGRWKKKVI